MIAILLYIVSIYFSIKNISGLTTNFLPSYLSGLVVRLFFLLLNIGFAITIVDGDNDAVGFLEEALYLFNNFSFFELLPFWEHQSRLGTYPIFVSLQFNLFGYYKFTPLVINLIIFELTTVYFARCILFFGFNKNLKWIFLLWNFWPLNLSYATILLREVWYLAVVVIGLYRVINIKKFSISQELIFVILSIISLILHPGMILFILSVYSVRLVNRLFLTFFIIGVGYFAITSLVRLEYGGGYFNFLLNDFSLNSIIDRANAMRDSPFAYNKYYVGELIYDLFVAFPIDLINFWFTPYPFPFSNFYYFGVFRYQSGIFFIILFLVFVLKKKQLKSKGLINLLVILFFASIPYVGGSSDVVQAVRHKNKYFPVVLVLLAATLPNYNNFKKVM
jgi:hypothetical protein